MKRIFVCSPFAGPTPEVIAFNVALARRLCAEVIAAGHAPYAPHLLMPQFLDDADPTQRATGIAAGQAYLAVCDECWCWSMDGGFVSRGMESDVTLAIAHGIPVLFPWGKPDGLYPIDPEAPNPLDGEVRQVTASGTWKGEAFDGLTVLATRQGPPVDLTPRPPLTADDLRTAIDAAAKPGTFVIRRGPVPTPPKPAPAHIRRALPVVPEPDDFRDTDVLDPDVADFVAEVDAAISLSHNLPSKAEDFASSVREKLESIRAWCVEHNAMTEAQMDAVGNMDGGMRRWIR